MSDQDDLAFDLDEKEDDLAHQDDLDVLEAAVSRSAALEQILNEISSELDRAGAPPDQSISNRVRQLARAHVGQMEDMAKRAAEEVTAAKELRRRRLPDERVGTTKKFKLPHVRDGKTILIHGYVTINVYEDGMPGEMFIVVDQAGSSARGYCDAAAIAVSIGLQHGIPIELYARKYIGTKFGPAGPTGEGEEGIPIATSVLDFVFRHALKKWPPKEEL